MRIRNATAPYPSAESASKIGIRAFSLLELLVSIVIMSVICAILLPSYQRIKVNSRNLQCVNHLRQIGLAALQYQQDSGGLLPTPGRGALAWNRVLVPYGVKIGEKVPLLCPADPHFDKSFLVTGYSYALNDLLKLPLATIFDGTNDHPAVRGAVVTHPSKTILMGDSETTVTGRFLSPSRFVGGRHQGRVNYVFCDGRVESLTVAETLEPINLWQYNK